MTDLLGDGQAVGAWQGVAARAVASGAADVDVEDAHQAVALLHLADEAKRRAATQMNDRSSRAHCLVALSLEQTTAEGKTVKSALTLADLGVSGYTHYG